MALYIMEAKAVLATMLRHHSLELIDTEFQWQEMPMVRLAVPCFVFRLFLESG